jgi:hypothetical protein
MAFVSLSMSADSHMRFGRLGCCCCCRDLDAMELIVLIADAADAVYFLFGIDGVELPHLIVFNSV